MSKKKVKRARNNHYFSTITTSPLEHIVTQSFVYHLSIYQIHKAAIPWRNSFSHHIAPGHQPPRSLTKEQGHMWLWSDTEVYARHAALDHTTIFSASSDLFHSPETSVLPSFLLNLWQYEEISEPPGKHCHGGNKPQLKRVAFPFFLFNHTITNRKKGVLDIPENLLFHKCFFFTFPHAQQASNYILLIYPSACEEE